MATELDDARKILAAWRQVDGLVAAATEALGFRIDEEWLFDGFAADLERLLSVPGFRLDRAAQWLAGVLEEYRARPVVR